MYTINYHRRAQPIKPIVLLPGIPPPPPSLQQSVARGDRPASFHIYICTMYIIAETLLKSKALKLLQDFSRSGGVKSRTNFSLVQFCTETSGKLLHQKHKMCDFLSTKNLLVSKTNRKTIKYCPIVISYWVRNYINNTKHLPLLTHP